MAPQRKYSVAPHRATDRIDQWPRTSISVAPKSSNTQMVERSIAWMTRGARRVPYRGVVKNNAWWVNRAAGINLKRLLNLGLSSQNGNWVLG